jgi:hypothetical protein
MPEGNTMTLQRVPDHAVFGGIDDYFQRTRRGTFDNSEFNYDGYDPETQSADLVATVGERVYIAFINGELARPVIIASANHPKQTSRYPDDAARENMTSFFRLSGFDVQIDGDGQVTFIHNGAPAISHSPDSALGGAAAALGDLLGGAAPDPTASPPNSSVTDNENYPDCKTLMEFLKLGEWRVRDALGQMIEVSADKGRIYIANNAIKSTDDVGADAGLQISSNSTDSEYVLLDRDKELVLINARSIIQLYSFDRRKDVTEGDHSHKIGGDEKITIAGDKTDDIDGSVTRTIKADLEEKISGGVTWTVDGDWTQTVSGAVTQDFSAALDTKIKSDWTIDCTGSWTLTSKGDISMSEVGGAGMKASGGKVEVGGAATGIFDTVSKLMEQLDKLIDAVMQITVPTTVGPSGPPINVAAIVPIKTQVATLKVTLDSVKGSL